MSDSKKNKISIQEKELQTFSDSDSNSDSDSDNDIDINEINNMSNKDNEIINTFKKFEKNLNLFFLEENSIKLEKNNINSFRKCYFLINYDLVNMDDETENNTKNKKQTNLDYIINNNLDSIKKELDISDLPHIPENTPIVEFVYGVDFKNNKSKVYLGFFSKEGEVGESFEFNGNKKIKRTYYQKKINNKNIFNKYKLLEPYKSFFNYKNFNHYLIREKNNKIDQVGLIYNSDIEVIHFIPLFTNICNKLKWNKKKLLKILYYNQDKVINIITFGKDYINIYLLENQDIKELTKEEVDKIHKKNNQEFLYIK